MKPFTLTIIILFLSVTAFSSGEQAKIVKANKAYSVGSYSTAVDLYQKVVDAGYASPELYYNMANAYFKMNEYPKAILWYERAKRIDPGNEDINFNLNVANTKISDKIDPLPELFYKRWFNGLVQLFSVDSWATMSIVMLITGLFCIVVYLVSHILILRKFGFWIALGLFFLSFFTMVLAWSGYNFTKSTREAIVFAPTITVKSSPDEKSTDLFVLHEGIKVRLLDDISDWYEIRIANGSVGWLPKSSLEKI